MKTEPLVKEILIKATPARVWKAITEKDEMKQWYFKLKDFQASVGFKFSFEGGPPEKTYLHLCKVIEAIPEKRLTYSWRYDGYPGESFVTFDILPEGDSTRVRLTHTGLETFPAAEAFRPENFNAGWTDLIQRSLKEFLEN